MEPPNKGHFGANSFVPCREVEHGATTSVPCREVVPISEGPLSEVPLYTFLCVLLLLFVHFSEEQEGQDGTHYEQRQQNQENCNNKDKTNLKNLYSIISSEYRLAPCICMYDEFGNFDTDLPHSRYIN